MVDRGFGIRAAVVAISMVLATSGCGSGNDGDGNQGGASAPSVARDASDARGTSSEPVGSDTEQIRGVLRDIQVDYNRGDGTAYCEKLIAAERRDVAAFGRNFNRGTTCVNTIRETSRQGREAGLRQKPTRFISARIKGRRAVATVSNGGRPPEPMEFVKVGGDWKIVESGFEPNPLSPEALKQAKGEKR